MGRRATSNNTDIPKIFTAFLAYLIISTRLPQLSKFSMESSAQEQPKPAKQSLPPSLRQFSGCVSSFQQQVNTCSFLLQCFGGCVTREIVYQRIAGNQLSQWNYIASVTFQQVRYSGKAERNLHTHRISGNTTKWPHSSKDGFGVNSYSEETLTGSSRSFCKCLGGSTLVFTILFLTNIQVPPG